MKKRSGNQSGFGSRSNNNHDDSTGEDDDEPIPDPNTDMTPNEVLPLIMKKLTQDGFPRTIEWLLKNGFPEGDANALTQIAAHLFANRMRQLSEEMGQRGGPSPKPDRFSPMQDRFSPKQDRLISPKIDSRISRGHRLGGNDDKPSLYDDDELNDLIDDSLNLTTTSEEEIIVYNQIVVDQSLPQTKLRVRLVGGGQQTITVNMSNTVKQLMEHIASISNIPVGKFKITQYPRIVITNLDHTIEVAQLENATIIQEKL